MKKLIALMLATISTVACATEPRQAPRQIIIDRGYQQYEIITPSWWFNIHSYTNAKGEHHKAVSIPMLSHESCSDAVQAYARDNYVYALSCTLEPVHDAINISHKH